MADLVEPTVMGYQADPVEGMDRLGLLLPDDWMMVFMKAYTPELQQQVREENDIDDLDYVVAFAQGAEEKFFLYNCVEGLGLGVDDDGDPFLSIEFEEALAEEGVFDGTDFYVGFAEKEHTYALFDQLVNILDPDSTAPLPADLPHDADVDPAVHPNVADARARRIEDGLV